MPQMSLIKMAGYRLLAASAPQEARSGDLGGARPSSLTALPRTSSALCVSLTAVNFLGEKARQQCHRLGVSW